MLSVYTGGEVKHTTKSQRPHTRHAHCLLSAIALLYISPLVYMPQMRLKYVAILCIHKLVRKYYVGILHSLKKKRKRIDAAAKEEKKKKKLEDRKKLVTQ